MKDSVAVLFLLVKLILLAVVSSHQAVNPLKDAASSDHMHQHQHQEKEQQQRAPPPAAGHHPHGFDRNAVQNQQHIMEDLDGKIEKPTDAMTEEELQFHYFKVHDYNNDNKLDGIELISALTHHNAQSSEGESKSKRISDSELEQLVDGILEDNDGNRDGFIDYPEFLLTQRQQ